MFFEILKDIGEFLFDYVLLPILSIFLIVVLGALTWGIISGQAVMEDYSGGTGIVRMPDGEVIQGEIEEYHRDSDTVEVVIDGVKYETGASNFVLIEEDNGE